jgi:hypothetical protein
MNEKRNRMLEKVRALLNKADPTNGATPEEAASFLAKAKELMTKHGIEEMEAHKPGDTSCFDIGRTDYAADRGRRNADLYVARVLKQCFGCDVVFTGYYKAGQRSPVMGYAIMGDAADRELAKFAAPIIYKTMIGGLSEWLRISRKKWSAAYERSFSQGVLDGYVTASEEGKALAMKHLTKDQKEQFGLILVQKDALVEAFKVKEFPKLNSVRTRAGYGSEHARQTGFGKGANMKLGQTHNIG